MAAHPSNDGYGSDLQFVETVTALNATGHDVVAVLPTHGPLDASITELPIRYHRTLVIRRSLLRPLNLIRALVTLAPNLARTLTLLHAHRPDVLLVNTMTLPTWCLAGRILRIPVVVHVHEANEGGNGFLAKLLNFPLHLATRIIANSPTSHESIVALFPHLGSRIVVIANGVVDLGFQEPEQSQPGRIVTIGRVSPRKGTDVAIRAVGLLRDLGFDVSLDIVGDTFEGYEWFLMDLHRLVADLNLGSRVSFLGYVRPIQGVLARSQFVVMPSYGESFGNVAVEAMFAGRIVFASRIPSVEAILSGFIDELTFSPGNAEELAERLVAFMGDPVRRRDVAEELRSVAVQHYSMDRYHEQMVLAIAGAGRDLGGD